MSPGHAGNGGKVYSLIVLCLNFRGAYAYTTKILRAGFVRTPCHLSIERVSLRKRAPYVKMPTLFESKYMRVRVFQHLYVHNCINTISKYQFKHLNHFVVEH